MVEQHLKDAIEEFKISKAVKEAQLTESDICRYILRALNQGLHNALGKLPEQQAQEFSQDYYKGAVGHLFDLQHIQGILKKEGEKVWKPLE